VYTNLNRTLLHIVHCCSAYTILYTNLENTLLRYTRLYTNPDLTILRNATVRRPWHPLAYAKNQDYGFTYAYILSVTRFRECYRRNSASRHTFTAGGCSD
jgi:hypothetical protein